MAKTSVELNVCSSFSQLRSLHCFATTSIRRWRLDLENLSHYWSLLYAPCVSSPSFASFCYDYAYCQIGHHLHDCNECLLRFRAYLLQNHRSRRLSVQESITREWCDRLLRIPTFPQPRTNVSIHPRTVHHPIYLPHPFHQKLAHKMHPRSTPNQSCPCPDTGVVTPNRLQFFFSSLRMAARF